MPNAVKLPHKLDRKTMTCQAVIETPKGGRSKFGYDEESGLFRLAGLLPEGMSFPLDLGSSPPPRRRMAIPWMSWSCTTSRSRQPRSSPSG